MPSARHNSLWSARHLFALSSVLSLVGCYDLSLSNYAGVDGGQDAEIVGDLSSVVNDYDSGGGANVAETAVPLSDSSGPIAPDVGSDVPLDSGTDTGTDGGAGTGGAGGMDALVPNGGAGGTTDAGGVGTGMADAAKLSDAAVDAWNTPGDTAPEAPVAAACGGPSEPCCAGGACTAGGCCAGNTCVASGATCPSGGTCAAGSCASPASLSASVLSLEFDPFVVGQSSNVVSFTIMNTGQRTSGAITVSPDNAEFAVQSGSAGDCLSGSTALAGNAACTVRVVFSPTLAGARTGTVTFSATPGGSASVSMSGTGVCPADQLDDGTGACVPMVGVIWTQTGKSNYWTSVASSADGTKLVAVTNGDYIYASVDAGATWTETGTSNAWTSVASSADGTKLVAVSHYLVGDHYIYTSVDAGATWTQRGTPLGWWAVASAADGTKLVAAGYGYIYTSVDSGATWKQQGAPPQYWWAVASSSDGTKLVAAPAYVGTSDPAYIYTSGDSGATWKQRGASPQHWGAVASSSDGTKLVAAVGGVGASGYIYTSGDSGATWTQRGTSQNWKSVASSSDGTELVAAGYGSSSGNTPGYIYTSVDSGVTWTQRGTSQIWSAVASSSNGTKLVAVASGGYIYTSTGFVP